MAGRRTGYVTTGLPVMRVTREGLVEMVELAIDCAEGLTDQERAELRRIASQERRVMAFAWWARPDDERCHCPATGASMRIEGLLSPVAATERATKGLARFAQAFDRVVALERGQSYRGGLVVEVDGPPGT